MSRSSQMSSESVLHLPKESGIEDHVSAGRYIVSAAATFPHWTLKSTVFALFIKQGSLYFLLSVSILLVVPVSLLTFVFEYLLFPLRVPT